MCCVWVLPDCDHVDPPSRSRVGPMDDKSRLEQAVAVKWQKMKVHEQLGKGGGGVVFRCVEKDAYTDPQFAVKVCDFSFTHVT